MQFVRDRERHGLGFLVARNGAIKARPIGPLPKLAHGRRHRPTIDLTERLNRSEAAMQADPAEDPAQAGMGRARTIAQLNGLLHQVGDAAVHASGGEQGLKMKVRDRDQPVPVKGGIAAGGQEKQVAVRDRPPDATRRRGRRRSAGPHARPAVRQTSAGDQGRRSRSARGRCGRRVGCQDWDSAAGESGRIRLLAHAIHLARWCIEVARSWGGLLAERAPILGHHRGVGDAGIEAGRFGRGMAQARLQGQLAHAAFPHAGGVGMA